jgi:hypothetical protein
VKPFHCLYVACTKSFTRPDHLGRHIAAEHTGERRWQCDFPGCEAKFYEQSHFTRHRSVHVEVGNKALVGARKGGSGALSVSRKRIRALSLESTSDYLTWNSHSRSVLGSGALSLESTDNREVAAIASRPRRVGAGQRTRGLAAGALLDLTSDLTLPLTEQSTPLTYAANLLIPSVAYAPAPLTQHAHAVNMSGRLAALPQPIWPRMPLCLSTLPTPLDAQSAPGMFYNRSRAHSLCGPGDMASRPHTPSAAGLFEDSGGFPGIDGEDSSRPRFPGAPSGDMDALDLLDAELGPDLFLQRDTSTSAAHLVDPDDPFQGPAAILSRVSPTALACSAPGLLSQLALSCPMPRCFQAFQHRLPWRNHIRTCHAGELLVCPEAEVCGGRSFKYVKQWERHVTACRCAGQAARVQSHLLAPLEPAPVLASSRALAVPAIEAATDSNPVALVADVGHLNRTGVGSSLPHFPSDVRPSGPSEEIDDDLSDFLHAALGLPPIAR